MASDLLYFNGVDATTGGYLSRPVGPGELLSPWRAAMTGSNGDLRGAGDLALAFAGESLEFLGPSPLSPSKGADDLRYWSRDADPEGLDKSGWGVIFTEGTDPAVREALKPLLDHRRAQATPYYRELKRHEGENLRQFLERHDVGPGPVDPEKMPYYLLLVGDPEQVPFEFQVELDVQYGVGRLAFDTAEEYHRYAVGVVRGETRPADAASGAAPSRLTFFGVRHPGDPATGDALDELVRRVAQRIGRHRPACDVAVVEGEAATKERLTGLLGGIDRPDVLVTSTHGLGFPGPDPAQRDLQGALVTHDWPGPATGRRPAPPAPEQYFAAADVGAAARLDGLICFLHGCHTAGTPRVESFSRHYFREAREQARSSFVSRLSQRLLSHEGGGALAVIGHVDKTWSSSFRWRQAGPQTQTFESALKEILDGRPVGMAMESFGLRYAELSTLLISQLDSRDELALVNLWTAHHDARNFVVVGDPAVRLRLPAAADDSGPGISLETGGEAAPPTQNPSVAPQRAKLPSLKTPRASENLEIRIFPDGGSGFRCSLKVGARSRSAPFHLALDEDDVARLHRDFVGRLGAPASLVPHARLLVETGEKLFAALFPPELRILYERTRERLEGRTLRLLFHVDPECGSRAVLSGLPWEWLYWRERQDFPSLNRRSPVVRFVEVDCPPPPAVTARVMRVLVATSGTRAMPSAAEESHKIVLSLARHSRIDVETLDDVSLGSLRARLSQKDFHAVHFIGHGLYDQHDGVSRIVLSDRRGRALAVSGEELAQTLRDFTTLRFVFFNSCDTARVHSVAAQPFAGVANALLRDGVPAVVAMQFPISHAAAVDFSEGFYRSLGQGDPLDAAVAEGRQAIRAARPNSIEWGTPVLFVRTTDLAVLGAPRDTGRSLRRLLTGAALVFLALYLVVLLAPEATEVPVGLSLQLTTSYLGFRLSSAGYVLGRLPVDALHLLDLEEIELPGSAGVDGGPVRKDGSVRRLGLRLESRTGEGGPAKLTLQQDVAAPAGARVEMNVEGEGGNVYRIAFSSMDSSVNQPFSVSIQGPYRFQLLRSARRSSEWSEGTAAPAPEKLKLRPRSDRFHVDVSATSFPDDAIAEKLTVDRLWLFERGEVRAGDSTELTETFHVRGGTLTVLGRAEKKLEEGSQLRLAGVGGDISALKWTEKGISFLFSGSVTRLTGGPLGHEVDLLPTRDGYRSVLEAVTLCLAALSALSVLGLYVPVFVRRTRARLASRP